MFKPQNKNKQSTLFKFLKYSRDVDNNEDSRQNEMEPCEEFPTEGTEESIYNSSDIEVNSSNDEDLDVDVNKEETSKDEIDREVLNYLNKDNSISQLIKFWRSGNQSSCLQYIRPKKEDGFARCVLSTVRGLNSGRQSLLNYMSTQLVLF